MARSEPYECSAEVCPLIADDLNIEERKQVHNILVQACGFIGTRTAPVLSRISGNITSIRGSPPKSLVITIKSGNESKDHKVSSRDILLPDIKMGAKIIYGEPLTVGLPMNFCQLQAAKAFAESLENGRGTLAYEKIASLTGVPKSSVFQSERIGLEILNKYLKPFMEDLKSRAKEDRCIEC